MRKKLFPLFVFIGSILLLFGCKQTPKESNEAKEYGFLRISLPNDDAESSRNLLNSQAASVADIYGVIIWDKNENYEGAAHHSEVIYSEIDSSSDLISLPVGSYKVLVLAGVLNNETASLCGSGSESSVLIEENRTTTVSITLAAPTLEIDYLAEKSTIYTSDSAALFTIHFEVSDGYLELGNLGYVYDFDGTKTKSTASFHRQDVQGHLDTLTFEKAVPNTPGVYSYGYAGTYLNKLSVTDTSETSYVHTQLASYYNNMRDWVLGPIGVESYDALFATHQFEVLQRPNSISIQLSWAED